MCFFLLALLKVFDMNKSVINRGVQATKTFQMCLFMATCISFFEVNLLERTAQDNNNERDYLMCSSSYFIAVD